MIVFRSLRIVTMKLRQSLDLSSCKASGNRAVRMNRMPDGRRLQWLKHDWQNIEPGRSDEALSELVEVANRLIRLYLKRPQQVMIVPRRRPIRILPTSIAARCQLV